MPHSARPHARRSKEGRMYSRQLRRSLAVAAGAVVAAEFAAREYERRQRLQQHQHSEGGDEAGLLRLPLMLQQQQQEHRRRQSRYHYPQEEQQQRGSRGGSSSLLSALLSGRGPADCKAAEEAYHAVPLPADDAVSTHEVAQRFRKYASAADLEEVCKFKKEKNGVKIYTVKEGAIPDPKGGTGLPVARVGEAVIQAPIEQVAALWWFFNSRADWDKVNTLASEVVEDYGPNTRLVYIKGAAKPMISSRDFVFVAHKVPPSDLGARFGTQVFVQTNAAAAVPDNAGAVRGNINSVILLESVDPLRTRVRYVCEIEPKGWLPTVAVEAAADDLPGVLGVMKQHLEAQAQEEDAKSLVERMESLREKDHTHPLLTESVRASREDLEALLKLLRAQLEKAKKDERKEGVELTDLKRQIQQDIKKTEARLRAAK